MAAETVDSGWRAALPAGLRPYTEREPLGALLLGISSGFPFAMIAATLTTRLAQSGIEKKAVTAFALAFLLYNFKFLWAPVIDRVRLPGLADAVGQRRAWLLVIGIGVMAAVVWLGLADPRANLGMVVAATLAVAFMGASYDIVIDAFRIESLRPDQLGVGSGMSQYGWRIGSTAAGGLALVLAERAGWSSAYVATALFALPAIAAGWLLGEPAARAAALGPVKRGWAAVRDAVIAPLADFLTRPGALIVLGFVLVHKIGDTLATLTLRLLFDEMGYSNDAIAFYDVALGAVAYLVGVFIGGVIYSQFGLRRAVLASLVLMMVSNLSFAALATAADPTNWGMAAAVGFENVASGIGGVAVVAYLSILCDLRFTATQFALLSAAASILGRSLTGTTAGGLIEALGFPGFYLLTTVVALPGVLLFLYMLRRGLVPDTAPSRAGESEATLS